MKLHLERTTRWEVAEVSPGRYSRCKLEFAETWTVYKTVNEQGHQTPVFEGTKNECEQFIADNS